MKNKQPIITERDQRTASYILCCFMFAKDMDEVISIWDTLFKEFKLCKDPFTMVPCTPSEYAKFSLEYEKQAMTKLYGHCDGLG